MSTPTRIYLVTVGDKRRLVQAVHPATALMHVARDMATVHVATQSELVQALQAGLAVEDSRAQP